MRFRVFGPIFHAVRLREVIEASVRRPMTVASGSEPTPTTNGLRTWGGAAKAATSEGKAGPVGRQKTPTPRGQKRPEVARKSEPDSLGKCGAFFPANHHLLCTACTASLLLLLLSALLLDACRPVGQRRSPAAECTADDQSTQQGRKDAGFPDRFTTLDPMPALRDGTNVTLLAR